MLRSLFPCVLAIGLLANGALAMARTDRFRIELVGGQKFMSEDAPRRQGSILIFRASPGGALHGVPVEMVLRVERGAPESDRLAVAASRDLPLSRDPSDALEPGEVVVLGSTGGNRNAAESEAAASNAAATASYPPWNGYAYGAGYGGGTPLRSVVTAPAGTVIGTDGLPRVVSTSDLTFPGPTGQTTLAPNGFPATPGSVTMIGPDGTPVLMPGAGAAVPVIGPNGTPVLGPATPATIGPNGFPVLARPGQPGATQPVVGPNGTPASAPAMTAPGQTTLSVPAGMPLPSGRPSSAAPAGAPAGSAPNGASVGASPNSGGPR